MTSIGSDSTFRDSWLEGAARAFFVTAYANEAPELLDGSAAKRAPLPEA